MKTIYRILGKRGRITSPFAFRQEVGFRPDDVLSFTIQEDQTVLIKREKLCNNCNTEKEASAMLTSSGFGLGGSPDYSSTGRSSVATSSNSASS